MKSIYSDDIYSLTKKWMNRRGFRTKKIIFVFDLCTLQMIYNYISHMLIIKIVVKATTANANNCNNSQPQRMRKWKLSDSLSLTKGLIMGYSDNCWKKIIYSQVTSHDVQISWQERKYKY